MGTEQTVMRSLSKKNKRTKKNTSVQNDASDLEWASEHRNISQVPTAPRPWTSQLVFDWSRISTNCDHNNKTLGSASHFVPKYTENKVCFRKCYARVQFRFLVILDDTEQVLMGLEKAINLWHVKPIQLCLNRNIVSHVVQSRVDFFVYSFAVRSLFWRDLIAVRFKV